MFSSFAEMEAYVLGHVEETGARKRVALAAAADEHALGALVDAHRKGIVDGTLIGDEQQICSLLLQMGEDVAEYEIVACESVLDASKMAVALVREGKADIEMKGDLPSADFLLPIMDPFDGLVDFGDTLSECTVFEYTHQHRLMFATDCALMVAPSLEQKAELAQNAVELARALGFTKVRVAAISALERVNPEIPSTQHAVELAARDWGEDVAFAGPYALDNALDEAAATAKGLSGEVAGHADVLLMPDLCSGNIFHKCVHYLGRMASAGVVCGTKRPVVFTSRSDSAASKYNSIVCAVLQAMACEA